MAFRWCAIVAGIVFAALLVAACNDGGVSNGDATAGPTATPPAGPLEITVYYGNEVDDPGRTDCSRVIGSVREVIPTGTLAETVLRELFAGPSEGEVVEGFVSEFSAATADILISFRVEGGTAYVNLTDIRTLIPNASSSCGSASFFAEVETTLAKVVSVERVIFAIEGDPEPFYEFVQLGCDETNDNCDTTPFQ